MYLPREGELSLINFPQGARPLWGLLLFLMEQEMTQVMQKSAADLVCVMLDVHIWSGRRHLEKNDLVHANPEFRKLPEKELANLGSVKICDPDDIRKFQTIKGKAERALKRAGLPILGAIGVPVDKFEELHKELVKLQTEFNTLSASFIAAYDRRVAEWKMKHTLENPGWAYLFSSIPTATHVAGRLSFDFHPYRISAPADEGKSELNARYEEQLQGLKGQLLKEVSAEASSLMSHYLMGKDASGAVKRRDYVTPKTLGPLKRAAEKLKNFKFLDPTIGPLADVIKETLDVMPTVGRIDGSDLIKIWSLARMLSSPRQAAEIAEFAAGGMGAEELLLTASVEQASSLRADVAGNTGGTDGSGVDAAGLEPELEDLATLPAALPAGQLCADLANLF